MSARSYGQYCGAAAALDAIGDRWTLLIVRDLLLGPLRYTDLFNSLDGIGTDALAERLRRLQQLGAVDKKTHDPPFAATTYQLTERGELLAPAIVALAEFGMPLLDNPVETESRHYVGWILAFVASRYSGGGEDSCYEFRTDHGTFHIELEEGSARARRGAAPRSPVVVLEAEDALNIAGVVTGQLDLDEVVSLDLIRIDGTAPAIRRLQHLLFLKLF